LGAVNLLLHDFVLADQLHCFRDVLRPTRHSHPFSVQSEFALPAALDIHAQFGSVSSDSPRPANATLSLACRAAGITRPLPTAKLK
jgi:hypothetical protein